MRASIALKNYTYALITHAVSISSKVLGKTKPFFKDWEIALPDVVFAPTSSTSLRELLSHIVRVEVEQFRDRQADQKLLHVLTPAAIDRGVASGKVVLGDRDWEQEVDVQEAIATALQAFSDGLYFVFIDDKQYEHLDAEVKLSERSHILFLRLVALAGG